MESLEVTRIDRAETLKALTESEVDVQITTAKKYPRNVAASVENIAAIATIDPETADSCFYSLKRKGQDGKDAVIEGPSIRLAEIVATCWGNLRVAARIIANDGKKITAQGICHDLQNNVAFSSEVDRRITTKEGRTYSEDMQIVTGNAASAIALRNAIFKAVPIAVINKSIKTIKQAVKDSIVDIDETRVKLVQVFANYGVTEEMLLYYMNVKSIDEIDADMIVELRGVNTAIKEKTASAQELFIEPWKNSQKAAVEQKAASTVQEAIKQKMGKQ